MSVKNDFINLVERFGKKVQFSLINDAFFPKYQSITEKITFNNFGAIKLEDNSIGIVYIALSQKVRKTASKFDISNIINMNPLDVAKEFNSSDLFSRTLALGAINAISQSLFARSNFSFDFVNDSLGLLNLNKNDKVGMVGYFPPLVKKIERMNIPLIVIEKKNFNVETKDNWDITMDPSELESCNKILCTSTTVLNDSIDDILLHSKNASKISMVGPTGGFLPDPVFERGVDVIGGTYISDSSLFMDLIRKNKKWGAATKKYCIQAKNYKNSFDLIEKI